MKNYTPDKSHNLFLRIIQALVIIPALITLFVVIAYATILMTIPDITTQADYFVGLACGVVITTIYMMLAPTLFFKLLNWLKL